MFKALSDPILSIIYPHECRVCSREIQHIGDGIACSECWNGTKIFNGSETLCSKCGAFLFEVGPPRSTIAYCGKCNDQSFDKAFAVGLYERALAVSLIRLKTTPHIPARLRRLLANRLDYIPVDESTVVVPIPLSNRRMHERGFNQAAIVARFIAHSLKLEIDEGSLTRNVHTPMHRAGMDRKGRAMTVKNAFRVARPKLIEGKNILLVDDIFTSGETGSSCAKALKKSGASTVNVLTIARAR
jgi:ComF family protein